MLGIKGFNGLRVLSVEWVEVLEGPRQSIYYGPYPNNNRHLRRDEKLYWPNGRSATNSSAKGLSALLLKNPKLKTLSPKP